jgi:uncharacterized protein with ATP-grasp and redox domains
LEFGNWHPGKRQKEIKMKTNEDCIRCIKNQILRVSEEITEDSDLRQRIIDDTMMALSRVDASLPPPYLGQVVHRAIREISVNPDPYRGFKDMFNRSALKISPDLRKMIRSSADPFRTAVLISLAGNIIDPAVTERVKLLLTIHETLDRKPAIDHIDELKTALKPGRTVLLVGDNAGETVMDRLLIEQFPSGINIRYAVRGSPVLNDATMTDAVAAGIDKLVDVLSNGSDAPGTILEDCSDEFIAQFRAADLAIAKGMGNFETLRNHRDQEIFFLLLVKCSLVGKHLGCAKGDSVVLRKKKGVIL